MEISTATGITRLWRNLPPTHYTLKVESLSSLLKSSINHRHDTCTFESGGYKWKLSLYPNGAKEKNVTDHVSLYLVIAETHALPVGWEVNVTFKFFLYNHMYNKYLTFQDAQEVTSRLSLENPSVGFDKLVPLSILKDPSKGYLLDDGCTFGVEVFVVKSYGRGECIPMIMDPPNNTFIWKIPNFTQRDEEYIYSDEFVIGDHKWKIKLYPKGNKSKKGSISLYLELLDDLPCGEKVFAKYSLRVTCCKKETEHHFCIAEMDWGFTEFISLDDINSSSNSYLVNGTLIVKAKIKVVPEP